VISNNANWLMKQGLEGKGIMMAPRWSVEAHLLSGELVELLTDTALSVNQNPGMGIYLLYQKPKYLVPKVKVFIDFLVKNLMGKHD
jgi:DNA-binding transcriptional LysR family regulator